jgi:glutamyl-tRNA reductase
MSNFFKAILLSYNTAPVEIREVFALSKEESRILLNSIKENTEIEEALIISTCNRTELYYSSTDDLSDPLLDLLCQLKGSSLNIAKENFELLNKQEDAIRHLFKVAAGLEAKVMGDMQIAGQVKAAYELSVEMEMTGTFIHRLMHTVFFTNKRISKETAFRSGAASVSFATSELIEELIEHKEKANILVIGLGKMGKDVCKTLVELGFSNITVINRTISKSEELAAELSGKCNISTGVMDNIYDHIKEADVIVSAIESKEPIIKAEPLRAYNLMMHKFFIDLSMPRNIEKEIEEIPGAILYNIDDIGIKTSDALLQRQEAIPAVRNIISESILDFTEWCEGMKISPVIQKMRETFEQIREEEIERYKRKISSETQELVEILTKSIIQKIIKNPVLHLKAACVRGESENMIKILNDVFDLNKPKKSRKITV